MLCYGPVLYTSHSGPLRGLCAMTLFPVPAFSDNYIWVLYDSQRALAVDPGNPRAF